MYIIWLRKLSPYCLVYSTNENIPVHVIEDEPSVPDSNTATSSNIEVEPVTVQDNQIDQTNLNRYIFRCIRFFVNRV